MYWSEANWSAARPLLGFLKKLEVLDYQVGVYYHYGSGNWSATSMNMSTDESKVYFKIEVSKWATRDRSTQ